MSKIPVTNIRGSKGDTGDQGPQGNQGIQGERGLPGANAVPADEAVAAYIAAPDSETSVELRAASVSTFGRSAVLYGAVHDGVTDDTAALQSFLDQHGYLPAGVYRTTAPLDYDAGGANNDLDGTFGASRFTQPSVLLAGAGVNSTTINADHTGPALIIQGRAHFATVRDLTIKCLGDGIHIFSSMHVTVEHVGIKAANDGIVGFGTGVHKILSNVIEAGRDSLTLGGGDHFVAHNDFYFKRYGVRITELGNDKIHDNTFTATTGAIACIYASGPALNQLHISSNQLHTSYGAGVSAAAIILLGTGPMPVFDCIITDNVIWSNATNVTDQVQITNARDLHIGRNPAYFHGGKLFKLTNVSDSIIAPMGKDVAGTVVEMVSCIRVNVTDPHIIGCGVAGAPLIKLDSSTDCRVSGGVVRPSSSTIIAIQETGTADGNYVRNVRFHDCVNHFVRVGGYSSYEITVRADGAPGSNPALVAGAYKQGDIVYARQPIAGGNAGWVCVAGNAAGTSGVWKTFGVIAS